MRAIGGCVSSKSRGCISTTANQLSDDTSMRKGCVVYLVVVQQSEVVALDVLCVFMRSREVWHNQKGVLV